MFLIILISALMMICIQPVFSASVSTTYDMHVLHVYCLMLKDF